MAKQSPNKKAVKKATKVTKSDFDPTQVGLAVAILASVSLVLLALIAMRS